MPIEITGPCELLDWILESGQVPGAQRREARGLIWIIAPEISPEAERIATVTGCKVHHIHFAPTPL